MWITLALTCLGGLLGISGSFAGQYWQAKDARSLRSETFGREDRYRLYEERRKAYLDFHLAFGEARAVMSDTSKPIHQRRDDLRPVRKRVWATYVVIWHIGASEVVDAATGILNEVDAFRRNADEFDDRRWGELVRNFAKAVRMDLIVDSAARTA